MSVLTLDNRIFSALACKMAESASNRQLNINYFHCCRDLSKEEITKLVHHWHRLNLETYDARYPQSAAGPEKAPKISFDSLAVNTYQFLKWLQCLDYNIDLDAIQSARKITPEEKAAHDFLLHLITDAMTAIINTLPQYDKAKWCDY